MQGIAASDGASALVPRKCFATQPHGQVRNERREAARSDAPGWTPWQCVVKFLAARPRGPVHDERGDGPEAAHVHVRHLVQWHCGQPDPAAWWVTEKETSRGQAQALYSRHLEQLHCGRAGPSALWAVWGSRQALRFRVQSRRAARPTATKSSKSDFHCHCDGLRQTSGILGDAIIGYI